MPNNPQNLSENNKSDIRWNYLLRKHSENAKKPDQGLATVKKSAVNAAFTIWRIVEIANLCFPNI